MTTAIDLLANEIRRVDGENSLGAGALAEALMPFIEALTQQGWRSIDSAPRDGVEVDLWVTYSGRGCYFRGARWNVQYKYWEHLYLDTSGGYGEMDWVPIEYGEATHWMPLPPAPTAHDEGGEDV